MECPKADREVVGDQGPGQRVGAGLGSAQQGDRWAVNHVNAWGTRDLACCERTSTGELGWRVVGGRSMTRSLARAKQH